MSEEAFKTAKCKLESHSGEMISDDTSGDKVIGGDDTFSVMNDNNWGDDEDLANIAETSEKDYLAKHEEPFTYHPYQVVKEGGAYSRGPDMVKTVEDGWAGIATPLTGVTKGRVEDCDLGSVKERVK